MESGPSYGVKACYAIDLSAEHSALVRSTHARSATEHEVLADPLPRPDDPTATALFERLRREAESDRAVLVACMPVQESLTRWLQTPFASWSKAQKVLPSLLDIQLPFPLESCVHQFVSSRKGPGGKIDALALAARRQDVEARIEALRAAGFDPARLDHEGLAVWTQSVLEMPIERNAPRAVALLLPDRCTLVLGRGEEFVSAHSIRTGSRELLPAGAALRPFMARVQQILRAQLPDAAEQTLQWVWAGPGAARPEPLQPLQEAMAEIGSFRFLRHEKPSSFLARAMAERALRPGPLRCNFRTGGLAHPQESKRQDRGRTRTAVSFLAAGLVLCAMNLAWRVALAQKKNQVQAAVMEMARSLSPSSRIEKGQEVVIVQRALEQRARQTAPALRAFEPSLMGLVADLLKEARQGGIDIEALSLRADSATIQGAAGDWNRCDALVARLQKAGMTTSVERQDAGADERVHFAVKGARGGKPAGGRDE